MILHALIPARAGSQRCPGKNRRLLGGVPLWRHTEAVACESGLFDRVFVCTDDPGIRDAWRPRAEMLPRTPATATATAPDLLWIQEAVRYFRTHRPSQMMGALQERPFRFPDALMILRPTSPFRTVAMLTRAWDQFRRAEVQSLRAVQPAREHPGKMWYCDGPGYPMRPVLAETHPDGTPWHSSPTQTLRPVYVQNASLEIVWTYVVEQAHSLSGSKIAPFFTQGLEGFDINTEADFARAEQLVAEDPNRVACHDPDLQRIYRSPSAA